MISLRGGAFTELVDGDQRHSVTNRQRVAESLGISPSWATVNQVHSGTAVTVSRSGDAGEGDGLITEEVGLPLALFVADCVGVVLHGRTAVGVAHAGWRGLRAGIVAEVAGLMAELGSPPERAVAGPAIGPCCFEVGPEVAELFEGHLGSTTWGTTSVDLLSVAAGQLDVTLQKVGGCTRCGDGYFSHRGQLTPMRMAAIGWLEP